MNLGRSPRLALSAAALLCSGALLGCDDHKPKGVAFVQEGAYLIGCAMDLDA